jgi:hypothetical protein
MLFAYNKNTKKISTFNETDLKSNNILERQDLEKWIENCPEIIGEELLILTTEYDQFDKTNERLDLLAIDKEGNLTVIELKRDDSGKNVELQAIKYAAYCSTMLLDDAAKLYQQDFGKKGNKMTQEEAKKRIMEFVDDEEFKELNDRPRIIIVSREYRPEVTASVLWLRKFGIDISCIKFTPYKMDDDNIHFESNILIPLPEAEAFIIRSEKKEIVEHSTTSSQEEYINFYAELINRLNLIIPDQYKEPGPHNYYSIPTGISGVHFEWLFRKRSRSSFGVELHFEKGNREFNKKAIDKLEILKMQLETALGEKVVYQKDWGRNWSRLYIEANNGEITEELKIWAVQKMKILIGILQPEIDKMK